MHPRRIDVEIPGEPVAQPRPRAASIQGKARIYQPKAIRNWKATAQQHMVRAMDGRDLLDGPLACRVTALFTCPKGDHRKRVPAPRRWHMKRPDAENVAKAVLDAATGVVWHDDDQVARLVVRKIIARQGEAPGVWLTVVPLEEPPSEVP